MRVRNTPTRDYSETADVKLNDAGELYFTMTVERAAYVIWNTMFLHDVFYVSLEEVENGLLKFSPAALVAGVLSSVLKHSRCLWTYELSQVFSVLAAWGRGVVALRCVLDLHL